MGNVSVSESRNGYGRWCSKRILMKPEEGREEEEEEDEDIAGAAKITAYVERYSVGQSPVMRSWKTWKRLTILISSTSKPVYLPPRGLLLFGQFEHSNWMNGKIRYFFVYLW